MEILDHKETVKKIDRIIDNLPNEDQKEEEKGYRMAKTENYPIDEEEGTHQPGKSSNINSNGKSNISNSSNGRSLNQSQVSNKYKKIVLYKLPVPQFESSSSLQTSAHNIIFTKAPRFRKVKLESADNLYNIKNNSFAPASGIGYGERGPLFQMNSNPGPNQYKYSSIFDDDIKHGKGHKMAFRNEGSKRDISPGPGAYKDPNNWKKQNGIGITSRHSLCFDDFMKGRTHISPQKYRIKYVENERYAKYGIGIGYGSKNKMKDNGSPGVGSYNLPSCFDLKRKSKPPIN